MAAATVTVRKLTEMNKFMTSAATSGLFTAVDASDGALITWGSDARMLLLVQNVNESAAKNVTVKAGNGIGGNNDLTFSVGSGKFTAVALDSDRFVNVSGDNRGKVLVKGATADIKVAAFSIPG